MGQHESWCRSVMIFRVLNLLWANLWRNRRRSILTILGVAVAIYVYATLGAAIDGITFPVRQVGADRVLNIREAARANVLSSRLPESLNLARSTRPRSGPPGRRLTRL